MPVVVREIDRCGVKKIGGFFRQLGTIVGVGGGYQTEIWVEGVLVLFRMEKVRDEKVSIINIFNKIMVVEKYDEHYKASISKLIANV
jgi:hypothetical protein